MKEIFHKEFPKYLAMGMTYELYWHGDASLPKDYLEAYKIKQKERNREMWRHGLYIYDALANVSPLFRDFSHGKPQPYMEYPIPLNDKERKEIEEDKNRRLFEAELKKMKARAEAFNKMYEGSDKSG